MFIERFRLDGKVALLTGAARGIGCGIATVLAEQGCAVAVQDLDEDAARATADAIRGNGGRAVALGGDITDLAAVESFVPRTVESLGGFHILVNNAGLQADKHYLEQSVEEMERQFRANLTSALRLVQLAVPIFKAQRWGRVINLGSIQGVKGQPKNIPYGMTKAGLSNMTIGLARELGKECGATINAIAPGWFDTLRNKRQLDEMGRDKPGGWIPAGRLGDDYDCAGLALLLCSEAGAYITGQTIVVDGGLTA